MSVQHILGDEQSVADIIEMLNEAGLNVTYDNHVVSAIWQKACVNGVMNPTCTILDCTIGELFGTEAGLNLVQGFSKNLLLLLSLRQMELTKKLFGNMLLMPRRRLPITIHLCTRIWSNMVERQKLII